MSASASDGSPPEWLSGGKQNSGYRSRSGGTSSIGGRQWGVRLLWAEEMPPT